ncbi:phage major capsid protein [Nesterenkonia suensis]
MSTITTNTSDKAWSPDRVAIAADDAVPEALLLQAATVHGSINGDEPAVRVPWVDDAAADFVVEGNTIPEADPALNEVVVTTGAVSQLLRISRAQYQQEHTANLLNNSVRRAVTRKADEQFMNADGTNNAGLLGVLQAPGVIDGGTIDTDLDPLADLLATIEQNNGEPDIIVASPTAWGSLRKLKTATDSHESLLGAGTDDQAKRLLGVPVVTSPAVPADQLAVIDSRAIAAAAGQVNVATSEHAYFDSDSVGLRVTWRIGWAPQHAERVGKLTTGTAA